MRVTPVATINEKAKVAIEEADVIILGPGDLYTSILANCVVKGVKEAVRNSDATIIYVCNLMSRLGQTIGMESHNYVEEIKKYLEVSPHHMICNSAEFPASLLEAYAKEGNHPVQNSGSTDGCSTHQVDVVSTESFITASGDTIQRSLIRHDSKKLAAAVMELIK